MTTPLPYLPTPHTWASEEVVRAPILRADVDGAIQLLSQPPLFLGAQAVNTQTIPNSTVTALTLDTEFIDSLGGHQISTTPARYWGIFAGWYLCEMTVTINSSATGTGVLGGMIGGVQNGGAATQFGGSRIAFNNAHVFQANAAKLMLMQQVGTFNGASNDWISAYVQQINPATASEPTSIAVNTYPRLSCRWVSAISGTQPLPVPANPAWPTPPTLLGHTFMNTNVRDAINFLIYPPIMEAFNNGVGTLASSAAMPTTTGTTTVMGTSVVDNYSAYNTTSGVWTAPVAGSYYCYAAISIAAGANSVCMGAGLTVTSSNYNSGTSITLWGGTMATVTSNTSAAVVRRRLRLNANDTVAAAAVQHDSTAAAAAYASGTFSSRFIMVWTGA